jgi:hypothetical protein
MIVLDEQRFTNAFGLPVEGQAAEAPLPIPPEAVDAFPVELPQNTFTGYAQDVLTYIRRRTTLQPQEM